MPDETKTAETTTTTTEGASKAAGGTSDAVDPAVRLAALEATAAEYETAKGTWAQREAMYQAGITDPEAIEIAQFLHGKMPKSTRPPLGELAKQWKADPSKAPPAMREYLPKPPAATTTPTEAKTTDAKVETKATNLHQGVVTATTTGANASTVAKLTAAERRAIGQRCQSKNDWTEWREAKQAGRV
jgi:hypothetical protein